MLRRMAARRRPDPLSLEGRALSRGFIQLAGEAMSRVDGRCDGARRQAVTDPRDLDLFGQFVVERIRRIPRRDDHDVARFDFARASRIGAHESRTSTKHNFTFSRLITCGHCGCSLVGELKKGKYVYYHCTGYKGKCPEPYVREEVLEEKFTEILKGLAFDEEVVGWVSEALRESHEDKKSFHDEAIESLQKQYARLQNRLNQMYVDKLDGRVTSEFFDEKSEEWRREQADILRSIEDHQNADQVYFEEGIQLLELP